MRIVTAALALLVSGCMLWPNAKAPQTGIRKTGEPLLVVDDVKVTTHLTREKLGEIRYEDDAGQSLGRSDVYGTRRHVNAELVWFPVQGSEVISDEDFFRIAGDQSAYDRTVARHAKLQRWNRRGTILALAGVASVVVGAFVPNPAKTLMALGGGLAVAGGFYLSLWSHDQMQPEYHAVDRTEAAMAADGYNAGRGVSASRSF